MKSFFAASLIGLSAVMFLTVSCKKGENDPMILPVINFKTAAGYTAANDTVAKGASVLIGINAAKSELNDVLKLFTITRTYDSSAAGNVYSETLSGAAGDSYSKDYPVVTRTVAGTEKYTFTVSNRDGLINSVSLTLTTQ